MRYREHGSRGGRPIVVVLHGGPGAPGSAGGLARLLAEPAYVLEPWQAGTTVAQHVDELDQFVAAHCSAPPVLVGHSWGAMLALAFGAAHPTSVGAIGLVACGTFDAESRAVAKTASGGSSEALEEDELDPDEFDEHTNEATWRDMLRLQEAGVYPAAFARIAVPVLMVQGADDPRPGSMIRASLAPHVPQLEYRELPRCGHYPWRERGAREEFARVTRDWLALQSA